MFWDDRVLRPEEGGASVSSFLLFADILASFALCVIIGALFSSVPAIFPGCLRLTGVRRVDRWGGISGCGVLRFEETGCNGAGAAGNTSPKSTSLT
jgi:hypothetical protein